MAGFIFIFEEKPTMKFRYLFLILFLVLISCRENAIGKYASVDYYFTEPQPINERKLDKLPPKFKGEYTFEKSNRLYLTEEAIYFQYPQNITLPLSKKDSIFKEPNYKGGKWVSYSPYTELYINAIKDSIYLSGFIRDSIFNLSSNNTAKLYKENLVLSTKDSIFWKVNILSVNKDSLIWKHLSSDDYINIKNIVKDVTINSDTTKVTINSSKKEFKQLLEMEMSWSRAYKKSQN